MWNSLSFHFALVISVLLSNRLLRFVFGAVRVNTKFVFFILYFGGFILVDYGTSHFHYHMNTA